MIGAYQCTPKFYFDSKLVLCYIDRRIHAGELQRSAVAHSLLPLVVGGLVIDIRRNIIYLILREASLYASMLMSHLLLLQYLASKRQTYQWCESNMNLVPIGVQLHRDGISNQMDLKTAGLPCSRR